MRLRRDFGAVLNLIRAHTVLHQASRERDAEGRIVASFANYATVRELVSAGAETAVPKTVRETVEAAQRLLESSGKDSIIVTTLAETLKLDTSATLRRARAAIDRGYLKNLEDRKGRPARLVLGDPLPTDIQVLPKVEELQGCAVASETEGKGTPPPPHTASERERFAL